MGKRKVLGAVAAVLALGALFFGATTRAAIPIFTGPGLCSEGSQMLNCINTLINTINQAITPASMAQFGAVRNLLDNGQMQVQQRGTGTRTCGTTTIPSSAYSADRWGCNVNVTSGAGTLQVITSNLPAQPVFNAGMVFYRTSGSLAQPQCVMQEIQTLRVTPLQGQGLVLSFYAQGLANMLAETTTLNAYVFYGTGSDEGLQSFTASPAITPAFTGINSSLTKAFTITSSWARYSYSFVMPAAATEAAVALCWTPTTGGTAGTTDGFRFTGVQLEVNNATQSPSAFEFLSYQYELNVAQQYYWQFTEAVSGYATVPGTCSAQSSTVAVCNIPLKNTMRKAPTVTCTFGTMKRMVAGTETALTACAAGTTTNGIPSVDTVPITATVASGDTAGFSGILQSGNSTGGGSITASADF
jgi:hypothetical protein